MMVRVAQPTSAITANMSGMVRNGDQFLVLMHASFDAHFAWEKSPGAGRRRKHRALHREFFRCSAARLQVPTARHIFQVTPICAREEKVRTQVSRPRSLKLPQPSRHAAHGTLGGLSLSNLRLRA